MSGLNRTGHIRLTSHPEPGEQRFPIRWGEEDPQKRGPLIGTVTRPADRNVIGATGGAYSLYRALAVSSGASTRCSGRTCTTRILRSRSGLRELVRARPDRLARPLGPQGGGGLRRPDRGGRRHPADDRHHQGAADAARDPDAPCRRHVTADGEFMKESGDIAVTKIAVDPVWHLPGIAHRFGTSETNLRRQLFEQTGGMFPELVTRPDLTVFLPPIGGMTAYVFGDASKLASGKHRIACRVHDECNGSDVFGSDICTCRPYLVHGIEECVKEAQGGGAGLIVYNRKEGRALGEVTKFLVYNARKRQEGGDSAATYFERTECVAGVQDARFQQLMPDILHWFGIRRIDRLMSMSNMKYDAIVGSGIEVGERVPIPAELIPDDASVEMEAKKAAGYYAPDGAKDAAGLEGVKGRGLERY